MAESVETVQARPDLYQGRKLRERERQTSLGNTLAGLLVEWKHEFETSFLAETHSQVLQQALKDLARA